MKILVVIFMLFLPLFVMCDANAKEKYTPHYEVVSEYIRTLGVAHSIQQTVWSNEIQNRNDNNKNTQQIMDAVRIATRFKLELWTSIGILKSMELKKPFDTLIPHTISFYKQKIELYEEIIKISKFFVTTVPEPGVDYLKMTARLSEITAYIEYIDESIFKAMNLVFALLIDEKPDNENHMSHLNITKAQRQELIDNIDYLFGESLDKRNKNWTVGSAFLLRSHLLKDYKCIDEWDQRKK